MFKKKYYKNILSFYVYIIHSALKLTMSQSKPSGRANKRKIIDEHRNFQEMYFYCEVNNKIICLKCNNAIGVNAIVILM